MTSAQQLEQLFGVSFQRKPDLFSLRQFEGYDQAPHVYNAFCEDTDGQLMGLCACGNEFEKVEIPGQWQHLTYLNLSDNKQLTELTFQQPLARLAHLDVSDSALKAFKLPEGMEALQWLDLSRNQLSRFSPLGNYPSLEYLDLSNNGLRAFKAAWIRQFPSLKALYLKNNDLSEQKKAFTDQQANCLSDMNWFLDELEQGATVNNECKVIVVGDGRVGKSCLVQRLVYDNIQEHHHSTQGITLQIYNQENEQDFPYRLNIWDFAGQDIYHATHRLFMHDRALYLALWDQYSQENEETPIPENGRMVNYPNRKLRYWLHYIKVFGDESPVLVIKTKAREDDSDHPERSSLRKQYKKQFRELQFLKLDSHYPEEAPDDFDDLKRKMKKAISTIKSDEEIPESWDNVRKWLRRKMTEKVQMLPMEQYLEKVKLEKLEGRGLFLLKNWLVPTGVVYYREGYFNDQIILDQNWVIKGVYAVLNRKTAFFKLKDIQRERHYLTGADLAEFWNSYAPKEMQLFWDFMRSCELGFELQEEEGRYSDFPDRRFVIPQLLPDKEPAALDILREQPDLIYLRYRHELLHDGILQSFIVRTSQLAELTDIWKNGTIIKDNDEEVPLKERVRAIIWARKDNNQESICIEIPRKGLPMLSKIRNLLEEIQGDLEFEEEVSLDGEYYVSLEQLEKWTHDTIEVSNGTDKHPILTEQLQVFLQKDHQASFESEASRKKSYFKGDKQALETPPTTTKLKEMDIKQQLQEIEDLISRSRLETAIDRFIELAQGTDEAMEAKSIKGQLSNLNRQERLNIIGFSDATTTRNKITLSLLSLVSSFEPPLQSGKKSKVGVDMDTPISRPVQNHPPKGFISYAHKVDRRYFDLFQKGVKDYSDWQIITDQDVPLGADWHERLQENIQECDFAIFLLSQQFFRSEYIKKHEFEEFIARNAREGFPFFSVLLTDCNYRQWEELSKRQIFVAYGQDYDLAKTHRDKMISFDLLVRFDRDGEVIPSSYRNTFYRNFVEKANQALMGK
jgi:GTPase SAR1 family protein